MVGDRDKYIGLTLAVSSSLLIGTSFIITKKGLIDATRRHGPSSDDHSYLKNPIWWAGMSTSVLMNFSFSEIPSWFICLLLLTFFYFIAQNLPVVVGELLNFAAYSFAPAILVTPLGALSVLIGAVLASLFLKENLGRIGTVGCGLCLIGSINIVIHAPADRDILTVDEILAFALQPGSVNPIYYVSFTTSTIFASVLLFQGFNTSNTVNVISLFCGFLTIFAGVFLLNGAKTDRLLTRSSQNGNGVLRSSISLEVHDMMKTRDATLLNAFNEESLGLTQLNDMSDSEEG
ncbi:12862_t:CDS:2 [Cetraspora pellucida]|uniref:12862_t:CDS:1 n=1 Tax=Cetraspora pellucida TaxID=1433469 RepID=A0ACA9MJZ3_9GLOM|nr:12862_t:CDS:2 [Cetraspora pellucida]